jgi:hypothetical protein
MFPKSHYDAIMSAPTPLEFMATLEHVRRDEIDVLRAAISGVDADLVEKIKWNAPSFGYGADDRVTLRLQPRDCLDIVLHRGVAKRSDVFEFDDFTGLVDWKTTDRGVIRISDRAMLDARLPDIVALVSAWLESTRD